MIGQVIVDQTGLVEDDLLHRTVTVGYFKEFEYNWQHVIMPVQGNAVQSTHPVVVGLNRSHNQFRVLHLLGTHLLILLILLAEPVYTIFFSGVLPWH
jgi:hypothetical protein